MSASDVSIYQTVPGSDGLTFGEIVADAAPTPEENFIAADEQRWHAAMLQEAMSHLDRRDVDGALDRCGEQARGLVRALAVSEGLRCRLPRAHQRSVRREPALNASYMPFRRYRAGTPHSVAKPLCVKGGCWGASKRRRVAWA